MRNRKWVLGLLFLAGVPTVASAISLKRGPYLQVGTSTNMIVRWRTDTLSDSRFQYGSTPSNLTVTVDDLTTTTEHEMKLSGLSPSTRYYYAVGTTSQILAGGDTNHFFYTGPIAGTPERMRLWVTGDFGTGDAAQTNVLNAYRNYIGTNYTDAILMLGDNAYESGTDAEFTDKLFVPYAPLMRQSVAWPCVGNHDVITSSGTPYFNSFTLPTAAEAGGIASASERYYSFDHGDIHFVCLDSQLSARTATGPMLTWLQSDLNATTQKWIIAYWHHPPYTKGSHNSDTESQLIEMRTNAVPILEAAGVDLVLCGHSHVYERSWFIDGHYGLSATFTNTMLVDGGDGRVDGTGAYQKNLNTPHSGAVYVVAGSGGKLGPSWVGGSTALTNPTPHKAMFVSLFERGSVALDIDGDRLDAKFINTNNVVRDYFTIVKGATLTVATADAVASETNVTDTAIVSITRTGATNTVLTVKYALTGVATNGLDYAALTGSITLPKGVASTNLIVTAIPDSLAEGDETVQLNLAATNTYVLGIAVTASVTIQDKPRDAWRVAKFGVNANNPGIACDTCDPDGDGAPNLAEYAFAMDPNVNSQVNLPSLTTTSGYLALTYRRPKPAPADIEYIGQNTGDLAGWGETTVLVGVVDNFDGTETVTIRDDVSLESGATQRFLRVKIQPVP